MFIIHTACHYNCHYSQLDQNGARFDFIHLHEGETFGTGELLLGLVVFEFEENSSTCSTKTVHSDSQTINQVIWSPEVKTTVQKHFWPFGSFSRCFWISTSTPKWMYVSSLCVDTGVSWTGFKSTPSKSEVEKKTHNIFIFIFTSTTTNNNNNNINVTSDTDGNVGFDALPCVF